MIADLKSSNSFSMSSNISEGCLILEDILDANQWWIRGHKARGQGQAHKKIRGQGQGQPFRGQTLLRPRTGMLESKAKDQGHSRKCSQKKIFFQKSFSCDLKFIGVARIFDWGGGLNHKSHAMTSLKFFQGKVFVGQRYRRMEDLKSLPAGKYPGFCKRRGLKLIVENCK